MIVLEFGAKVNQKWRVNVVRSCSPAAAPAPPLTADEAPLAGPCRAVLTTIAAVALEVAVALLPEAEIVTLSGLEMVSGAVLYETLVIVLGNR